MKKNNRKKLNREKILFFIILILLVIYLYNNFLKDIGTIFDINSFFNVSNKVGGYKIIKQDINKKYPGKGQEKVKNKNGYFTTFTTTDGKTYIEYKQNGKSSWSNNEYWGSTMAENRMWYNCYVYYIKRIW